MRARANADLKEAMTNDQRTRDAALASGAQMISTDFPFGEKAHSGYRVAFPEAGIARCSPINAAADCPSAALESARYNGTSKSAR